MPADARHNSCLPTDLVYGLSRRRFANTSEADAPRLEAGQLRLLRLLPQGHGCGGGLAVTNLSNFHRICCSPRLAGLGVQVGTLWCSKIGASRA